MSISPEELVRRDVHYCASQLVTALCAGAHAVHSESENSAPLADATEQAIKLSASLPDFEEAAIQNGWMRHDGGWIGYDHDKYASPEAAIKDFASAWHETAEQVCEANGIDPYECAREVFEHWIVSDWLATKLADKGEKVDKDFMGLTIWARTTTGQAIYLDAVIEDITADLNKARGGAPFMDLNTSTAKGLPGTV